jgi:hypothetical protein
VIAQLKEADLLGKIRLGTPSASPGGNPLDPVTWYRLADQQRVRVRS